MSDRVQVEPRTERVVVKYRDTVLAEANRSVHIHEQGLPERIYVPRSALKPGVNLERRDGAHCPWKGDWHWLDTQIEGQDLSHMIWEYHAPNAHCAQIRNHIAVDQRFLTVEVNGQRFK